VKNSPLLPKVVQDRLVALNQLGIKIDADANLWLMDQSGSFDEAALTSIAQARRAIELMVDLALSYHVENHPALFAERQIWERRFARIAAAIAQKQNTLTALAHQHAAQTRAAQAYIGTKGLND
jgi:hypothetical protein